MGHLISRLILWNYINYSWYPFQHAKKSMPSTDGNTNTVSNPKKLSLSTETKQKETQTPMVPNNLPLIVIAHRGARSLAPENTLLAAQKAFDLGADMWELDVAMTYDDQLVVIHDKIIKKNF